MILPIYAGLERIPSSLLEASADLGGKSGTTFRRVVLPLVFPALVAGSIFTFSLTLGDYITPDLVSDAKFIGNVIYDNSSLGNLPLAAAYSMIPIVVMTVYLLDRAPPRRVRVPVSGRGMTEPRLTRIVLRIATALVLAFLYLPLVILAIYAFNPSRLQVWPPTGFTLHWFGEAASNPALDPGDHQLVHRGHRRDRDRPGPRARSPSLGVQRYSFFGRQTISFLLVLPIALPGRGHRHRAADDVRHRSGSTSGC